MMGALTWLLGAYPSLWASLANGLWGNGETRMLMKFMLALVVVSGKYVAKCSPLITGGKMNPF